MHWYACFSSFCSCNIRRIFVDCVFIRCFLRIFCRLLSKIIQFFWQFFLWLDPATIINHYSEQYTQTTNKRQWLFRLLMLANVRLLSHTLLVIALIRIQIRMFRFQNNNSENCLLNLHIISHIPFFPLFFLFSILFKHNRIWLVKTLKRMPDWCRV